MHELYRISRRDAINFADILASLFTCNTRTIYSFCFMLRCRPRHMNVVFSNIDLAMANGHMVGDGGNLFLRIDMFPPRKLLISTFVLYVLFLATSRCPKQHHDYAIYVCDVSKNTNYTISAFAQNVLKLV